MSPRVEGARARRRVRPRWGGRRVISGREVEVGADARRVTRSRHDATLRGRYGIFRPRWTRRGEGRFTRGPSRLRTRASFWR